MKIRGLGPKSVKNPHQKLKIKSLVEESAETEERIKLIKAKDIATSQRTYLKQVTARLVRS